jgi:hypothetical protein
MDVVKQIGYSDIGARVVRIRGNGDSITANQRALVNGEFKHNLDFKAAKLPIPSYKDNQVFEFRHFYTKTDIMRFYSRDNNYFTKQAMLMKPFFSNNSVMNVFRPVLRDSYVALTKKDYTALIDLGCYCGADAVALPPYMSGNMSAFKKITKVVEEHSPLDLKKGRTFRVMAPISALEKPSIIKKKLKIINNQGFEFLHVENDNLHNCWTFYSRLRNFLKDKDICAYGSNTPKFINPDWRTAMHHVYSFLGFNIISPQFRVPFLSKGYWNAHDKPKSAIKLFDPNTNGFIKRGEFNERYGESLENYQNIPFCTGKNLTEFFDNFDNQTLTKIGKVIEIIKSQEALKAESQAIVCGEFRDLMLGKECMNPWVSKVTQSVLL